ncbi:MAG TPA: sigma-70 family RNA polymerase sigma factor [Candidatus Hydrogenedentes bacterium]|nr:sigma-70 family RNA polymerase sigma factor [Candidatus Hydrogenedentota bacterium]HRK33866.1 sigma-70 family RNA polymerase sigma factor [Candidatus Hydrogenedentota bacterium]
MESQNLEQLVAEAQKGDESAFAALVNAHYRSVLGLAYSTVGDWSAAQDVAQDTFISAWANLGKLRGAGAFPMWIRKIARNLALNWIRSADYRRRLAERHSQLAAPLQEDAAIASERIAREERRTALWHALQELKPPIREALILYYLEGRSISEAARQLGISENAFKLRMHTGRQRLRTFFEQQVEESLYKDLLPPDRAITSSRILAGLAIGPVMPQASAAASGSGLGLWLDHFIHNAPVDLFTGFTKGGILVASKKTVVAVLATIVCIGGAYWGFSNQSPPPKSGENWQRVTREANTTFNDNTMPPDPTSGANESAGKIADAAEQYAFKASDSALSANQHQEELLKPSGEMTASATLLMSLERGKIEDPEQYVTVSGVVLDTRGDAISGATVQVFAVGGGDSSTNVLDFLVAKQNPAHKFTAITNEAGRFLVSGVMYEGSAAVSAFADGYTLQGQRPVQIQIRAGDSVNNLRITMEQGKGLHGRLLAPDGSPVQDGNVTVVAFRSRGENPNGNLANTNTDANGRFHFAFPRQGNAFLVTSSLKYGGASFDDIPVGTDDIVELKMPAAARLTGTISGTTGEPLENLLVLLQGTANDGSGQRRVEAASLYAAKTDSSGKYAIEAIDTNQAYTVHVANMDRSPRSQPLALPDFSPGSTQTWNYTLQETIQVRGRVTGEKTGLPLANIKVAALKDGAPVLNSETAVNADGTYEMSLTSGPGNYVIYPRLWRIEPDTTGYDWGRAVVLTPEQDTVVDLTFMDTATISIRVVDASGAPIDGMMLGLREDDHTWMPVAKTSDDGRFKYAGVMPGVETNFVVYEGRDHVGATTPVIAEPGEVVPEETVVVYGSAGIEGIATKPDGSALQNGVLIVRVFYALTREVERRVNTDSSGHFVIEGGLPATPVILAIEGFNEEAGAIDKFYYESDEILLVDGQIQNLGAISFALDDSNIEVE